MKFIHLTDTHLIAPPQEQLGIDRCQRLVDSVASINANHTDTELCRLTGDLTNWAEPGIYDSLIKIMGNLTPNRTTKKTRSCPTRLTRLRARTYRTIKTNGPELAFVNFDSAKHYDPA